MRLYINDTEVAPIDPSTGNLYEQTADALDAVDMSRGSKNEVNAVAHSVSIIRQFAKGYFPLIRWATTESGQVPNLGPTELGVVSLLKSLSLYDDANGRRLYLFGERWRAANDDGVTEVALLPMLVKYAE